MPHFKLMDPGALGPERAALQRSRLHLRSGRRRLREGRISAGIVTLFDALECALEWYVAADSRKAGHDLDGIDLNESREIFRILTSDGKLAGTLDFGGFNTLVEKALHDEMEGYDYRDLLDGIESALTRLGVLPFDESTLPEEIPES